MSPDGLFYAHAGLPLTAATDSLPAMPAVPLATATPGGIATGPASLPLSMALPLPGAAAAAVTPVTLNPLTGKMVAMSIAIFTDSTSMSASEPACCSAGLAVPAETTVLPGIPAGVTVSPLIEPAAPLPSSALPVVTPLPVLEVTGGAAGFQSVAPAPGKAAAVSPAAGAAAALSPAALPVVATSSASTLPVAPAPAPEAAAAVSPAVVTGTAGRRGRRSGRRSGAPAPAPAQLAAGVHAPATAPVDGLGAAAGLLPEVPALAPFPAPVRVVPAPAPAVQPVSPEPSLSAAPLPAAAAPLGMAAAPMSPEQLPGAGPMPAAAGLSLPPDAVAAPLPAAAAPALAPFPAAPVSSIAASPAAEAVTPPAAAPAAGPLGLAAPVLSPEAAGHMPAGVAGMPSVAPAAAAPVAGPLPGEPAVAVPAPSSAAASPMAAAPAPLAVSQAGALPPASPFTAHLSRNIKGMVLLQAPLQRQTRQSQLQHLFRLQAPCQQALQAEQKLRRLSWHPWHCRLQLQPLGPWLWQLHRRHRR